MSKTDKTRPYWVKKQEHYTPYPRRTTPIYEPQQYWIGEMRCGCRLCTDYYGRKEDRRKERYVGRRQARTWQTDL